MAHEVLVKRILYVGKCPTCGEQIEWPEHPPKEWFCGKVGCQQWIKVTETEYTGPELKVTYER